MHPDVSYYVNLDVMPGEYRNKKLITKESTEQSCKESWQNYKRMIQELPKEKVLPVYHKNEDIKWLDKYLSLGCPYIGISPLKDNSSSTKIKWVQSLRKYLFDGAGRPVCKTHGFALASYDLMVIPDHQWYSVDSSTWKLWSAYGRIYLPRKRLGKYAYHIPPVITIVSLCSDLRRQHHTSSMSPHVRELVDEWLVECGFSMGESEIIKVESGYKPKENEVWHNKHRHSIVRCIVRGISNSLEDRLRINAKFIKRANAVLPLEDIYFAGSPMPHPLEFKLGRRLLSFHTLGNGKSKCLENHLKSIRGYHACGS